MTQFAQVYFCVQVQGGAALGKAARYYVTGMDCPSCAKKIEKAVRSAGINNPEISTAYQLLTLNVLEDDDRLLAVERAVAEAGYHLHPMESAVSLAEAQQAQTHVKAEYRRALWIVITLNVGYGLIEMIGGFFAGSQTLKARCSGLSR